MSGFPMTNTASFKDLASLLAQQALTVVKHLFPEGVLEGHHFCIGNVDGAPGRSLKITVQGDKTGLWKDFAADQGGDLIDLWYLSRHITKSDALKEIKEFLKISDSKPAATKPKFAVVETKAEVLKPISREYLSALMSRLSRNAGALTYLTGEKRGLDQVTIDHFGLGLSAEKEKLDGTMGGNALVAPMRSLSGGFLSKSAYINVPDVTINPTSTNGWMKGEPQTYYSDTLGRQRILFVCEGLKDVWRHWRALSEAVMTDQIMLISSTHGSAIPAEWKSNEFWKNWDRVYLGQDNDEAGNKIAEKVLEYIGRQAHRIKVPEGFGKDWTDFWQNEGSIEYFKELLDDAPVASAAVVEKRNSPAELPRVGRFSHRPIDINSAYVDGNLYYPTETHVVKLDEETGTLVERLETLVIRSDRSTHRSVYAPAPPNTPLHKRVLKLTDGTVIEKEPVASRYRTWDFESINTFVQGKANPRSLKEIIKDIYRVLKQAIWLPYEEDYAVLALTVPVTYTQVIFESVPLILMNGPTGSGKSQTGNVMAKLCCNGMVIGQVSAAAAARIIDETRGFVSLDDVESIALKAGKDSQATDFMQAMKVSYNKHTAKKIWTDMKTGKQESLDFYGVKLIGNTLGTDSILGSRMIRIQTRKMPDGMNSQVKGLSAEDLMQLHKLRNELHCWAFENVANVDAAYQVVYANKTDRHAEISAPLRTMAKLACDQEISKALETALARQHVNTQVMNDDPVETLKEAVRNLIKSGYEVVTLTHLRLEMRALLDANYGQDLTNSVPEWDRPEWLGRQLRSNDLVSQDELGRQRFYGKNLRLVKFAEWVVDEIVTTHDENGVPIYKKPEKEPGAFCQGCKGCPYRAAGCELQDLRAKDEASQHGKRPRMN